MADGSLRSVIAETADGRIVGHMALTIKHPGARAVEAGNTVVDPEFRGQRLALRMGVVGEKEEGVGSNPLPFCRTRVRSTHHWWRPIWPGVRLIIWWASISPPFYGVSCQALALRAVCNQ